MQCWYPIIVPRYSNYRGKDGLVYTRIYGRMQVPCGRCPACRRRKQNEWAFRILEESKYTLRTAFVTLTVDDDHLLFSPSGVNTLSKKRVQKFTKDLRYRLGQFRYFICGEYGDVFDRSHYHMILFYNGELTDEKIHEAISQCWPDGHSKYETPITAGRAKYCSKYSMKRIGFDYGDVEPPFALMSRKPGLGKMFLDQLDFDRFRKLDQWCVHDYKGTPYTLPRYYKERIYSKDEIDTHSLLLEKLLNSKLDNEIRESDNYFKYDQQRIINRERLFIKSLRAENYKFNYQKQKQHERRPTVTTDLVSDEF